MDQRPNILVFVTDQQRADTIGALGNDRIRTPVLDQMTREGTAFTRAYTPSPVCVPARCSMATGRYPATNQCWDNMPMPDAPSYMERLRDAGYQTHGVGKMHFEPDHQKMWGYQTRDISEEGKPGDFIDHLHASGYEHVLAPHGLRGEYYYTPQPSQLPAHLHETHWLADRSIDFLRQRDRSRPFLLDCHFIKPHPPFENPMPWSFLYRCDEMPVPYWPDDDAAAYLTRVNHLQNRYKYKDRGQHDDLAWRTLKAAYYGAISFIDQQVGRVLEALGDDLDNTLVVFTSDHGEMLGDYGCAGKRCMLEASVRIPLLARLPETFACNHQTTTAVSLVDLFPTFLDLAGIKPSEDDNLPGSSLRILVESDDSDRVVFSQFQAKWMGHYLATNGREKFVHSAADRRSWNFEIGDEIKETPVQSISTSELESAALAEFALHPATEAVVEGTWQAHDVPPWPDDPDYGLLRQDPEGLQQMLEDIRPYFSGQLPSEAEGYQAVQDHMPD